MIFSRLTTFIHSFIQALKQVSNTVYSEYMTIETVNKFSVITGRKSPHTRYHRAIHILQFFVRLLLTTGDSMGGRFTI